MKIKKRFHRTWHEKTLLAKTFGVFVVVMGLGVLATILILGYKKAETMLDPEVVAFERKTPAYPIEVITSGYRGNLIPEEITLNVYEAPYACHKLGDGDKFNGYYYDDPFYEELCIREKYYWIPGINTVQSQFLTMPDVVIGSVWAYEPELMEETAKFHNISLKDVGGHNGIAVPFCSEIGNYFWILRPYNSGILGTGVWEGPFRAVDCAGLWDLYNVVVHRGEIGEISWDKAVDWTMVKDVKEAGENLFHFTWDFRRVDEVILSKINPKDLPEGWEPVYLSTWFVEHGEFYRNVEEYNTHFADQLPVRDEFKGDHIDWRIDGEWESFYFNSP